MQSRPCDNLSWSHIRSEPAHYQVVVAQCLQLGIGNRVGNPAAAGPIIAATAALGHH